MHAGLGCNGGVVESRDASCRATTLSVPLFSFLQRIHRPAARDTLDEQTPLVGVPAHVHAGAPETLSRFFAVELTPSLVHDSAYRCGTSQRLVCILSRIFSRTERC